MTAHEGYARDISAMKEALDPLLRACRSDDAVVATCALQALTVVIEGLSHLDPTNFASYEQLIVRSRDGAP